MTIQFGKFTGICEMAPLVICPLVQTSQGVEPTCYSRNVDLGGTLIFQPSTCVIHVAAIFMTGIMIYHIRSKYTAVGRKEILMFFYLYALVELLAIFLDSGIIPTASAVYPWFTAVYTGLVAATYCCLLVNAFVGFQFAEDGTPLSLWMLRIACLVVFGLALFVAIATFKQFAGFKYTSPIGLFIVYILWPLICTVVYVVSQLVLVFRTLEDRWPIGDIVFGTAFFVVAQVVLFGFSVKICDAVNHYIDGLFFYALCMLLSVMMVYKYWDSITKEDLEFSVGSKAAVWEVKDPLLAPGPDYSEEDTSSYYPGGNTPASLVGGVNGQQFYNGRGNGGQYGGRVYPPSSERY
ncbi:CHS7 [Sanghuangporus baumii]